MNTKKAIGGSVGAILILIVSQVLAQLTASLFFLIGVPEGICNILSGVLYLTLAYMLLVAFAQKILKLKAEILGLSKFNITLKWAIVALLLPVCIKVVYLLLPGQFIPSNMNGNQVFSRLSAGIVFTGIAAGFVEEMVFRGFILKLLEERWNRKIAILIPSFLFGLVHIIGMNFSVISSLLAVAAGTMVGVMFSLIAIESQSVWDSGIVHALWNMIIIGGGLSISEKIDEYAVMTYVLDSKSFLITGGEFGIESSIIAVIGYVTVIIFALWRIKKKNE